MPAILSVLTQEAHFQLKWNSLQKARATLGEYSIEIIRMAYRPYEFFPLHCLQGDSSAINSQPVHVQDRAVSREDRDGNGNSVDDCEVDVILTDLRFGRPAVVRTHS